MLATVKNCERRHLHNDADRLEGDLGPCCGDANSVCDFRGGDVFVNRVAKSIIDIIAVGGAVGGSAIMAANIGMQYAVISYVLFLVSSIASVVILSGTVGTKSLTIVNFYFILINVVGIIRYS